MGAFTFFDVETPNRTNAHICQIGVIRTDGQGRQEYRRSFYVNPQTFFDDFNVNLHGVSPRHVEGAPTLAELWESELAAVFAGSTLVAHSARSVDLTILSKDLLRYDYDSLSADYLCTLAMARSYLALPAHGLAEVAQYYGIPLEQHHDAMCDTDACAGVFWAMVRDFGMPTPSQFIYTGQLKREPSAIELKHHAKTMAELFAVLSGIAADSVLTSEEHAYLEAWWKAHHNLILDESFAETMEIVLAGGPAVAQAIGALIGYSAPFVSDYGAYSATVFRNLTLGILDGIQADREVNVDEARALAGYLRERTEVADNPDFLSLLSRLEGALDDGVLTPAEKHDILTAIDGVINPLESAEVNDAGEQGIEIAGKRFVLTGQFEKMGRGEVGGWIAERGGELASSISGKVDYLVVGGCGSSNWAYGNHGTKIKKALELQQKGKPIQILRENDFFDRCS